MIAHHFKNFTFHILPLILFGTVGSSVCYAQQNITIATYRYSNNDRIENIKPLASYLSKTCRCEASVVSYESVAAMLEGMQNHNSDIVLMNTFGYLLLDRQQANYKPVVALQVGEDKKSTYQSVIVTKNSLGIKSLHELKKQAFGLELLLVNPGSTSGNLVPRLGLASVGITHADQSFKSITYAKSHALTLEKITAGSYDVGAFGSEEYTNALASDPALHQKITLLWRSEDIPLGPVMLSVKIDKDLSSCIVQQLLSLHVHDQAVLESVKSGWVEALPADRYVPITDLHYKKWLKSMGGKNALVIIKKFTQ